MKRNSALMPSMTSGAASVPRTTASVEEIVAISSESLAADSTASLANRRAYHSVENPPQTLTERVSLNENATTLAIGRYRKA